MAEEGKTNGNGFLDFCSDAQGIKAYEESHPRLTNSELKLVYVIRAPGAGDKLAPNSSLHLTTPWITKTRRLRGFSGGAG